MNTTLNRWLLGLIALLGAAGCHRVAPPDGSGTMECTQVRVAPEVGGRINHLLVQEGDRLQAGQIIARIDTNTFALRRDETAAALAQAQAQLDLLLAGSREEDVQRAREQLREARAMSDSATSDLKRIGDVFAAGSATAKQMDDAKASAERTAATTAAAEQQLNRLIKGNREQEIRAAQAAVALAQARLAQAEKLLRDCVVAAPSDGIVTTRSAEPGEVVAPGTPLVTLSRLDEVWLSLYIAEPRLRDVRLGQKAYVAIDGDARRYEGTVTFISPEAEFTPRNIQTPDERTKLVYRIKITLPNPQGLFKPGMPADGYLKASPSAVNAGR
jgi:HlyD family secretion protein